MLLSGFLIIAWLSPVISDGCHRFFVLYSFCDAAGWWKAIGRERPRDKKPSSLLPSDELCCYNIVFLVGHHLSLAAQRHGRKCCALTVVLKCDTAHRWSLNAFPRLVPAVVYHDRGDLNSGKKNDRIDKIPVFFYLYLYVFPHVNSPFPNSLFFLYLTGKEKKWRRSLRSILLMAAAITSSSTRLLDHVGTSHGWLVPVT